MRAGDPSACSVLLPGLGDYSLLGALLHPPHIQVPTCFQLGLLGQPRPERWSLSSEKLAFLFLCSQMARPLTTPSPSQTQARKKRRGVSEQQPLRSPGGVCPESQLTGQVQTQAQPIAVLVAGHATTPPIPCFLF